MANKSKSLPAFFEQPFCWPLFFKVVRTITKEIKVIKKTLLYTSLGTKEKNSEKFSNDVYLVTSRTEKVGKSLWTLPWRIDISRPIAYAWTSQKLSTFLSEEHGKGTRTSRLMARMQVASKNGRFLLFARVGIHCTIVLVAQSFNCP